MIAHAFFLEGKKVALFTSPHFISFRERIRVIGESLSKEQTLSLYTRVMQVCYILNVSLSFYEISTLMAFLFFSDQSVDMAIIETGLGGRLDATNVCHPILSVITSIGKDHACILGESLNTIAMEKAGIIKNNVPVVLGPTCIQSIFEKRASEKLSPLWRVFPKLSRKRFKVAF